MVNMIIVQVLITMLESETEYKIILKRIPSKKQSERAPAIGVRISFGYTDNILYSEQDFDERWYRNMRDIREVTNDSTSYSYQ